MQHSYLARLVKDGAVSGMIILVSVCVLLAVMYEEDDLYYRNCYKCLVSSC